MSIRPSYGRRSVLQVLSDGMSQRPPTGTSCCEDAALNAAEVDRLTRERDELHGYIAEYRDMWDRQLRRAECAEAELDRMCKVLAVAKAERDELQAKLDDAEVEIKAIVADRDVRAEQAENRPTLDREAVQEVVSKHCGHMGSYYTGLLIDELMALAPAVPSWLGDVPDKPEVVKESVGIWKVDGLLYSALWSPEEFRRDGYRRIALADAIDAEEAQRSAEEEARIEEQAKALWEAVSQYGYWGNAAESARERCRAAIRAGWTKEDDK